MIPRPGSVNVEAVRFGAKPLFRLRRTKKNPPILLD
jgi:hypothetical protein